MTTDSVPTDALRQQVEAHMGKKAVAWKRPECGLTQAQRFVVKFADGSGVFVKAAVDDQTQQWLQVDHLVMSSVGAAWAPQVLGWIQGEAGHSILLIEDLGAAHWPADQWPVNWRAGQMDILLDALQHLAAVRAPQGLPVASGSSALWRQIEANPDAFLQLDLCSRPWFDRALEALVQAEETIDIGGDRLVHNDVRSDNLCFLGQRLVLVDWSQAFAGHADFDRAAVLPGLHLEGGPEPYDKMPEGGGWAARGSAIMAQRALDEAATRPEWLIDVLRRLAAINLTWAARCLELPAPDGVDWHQI
ncbi:MAG: hypothetical protein GKR89_22490 [Candidatus Latescibacteria bacterium]|nr:hypothetical protein [Candidatus Latescibacterota bacterium]